MDSETPCAKCNVCGGTSFGRGPSDRLAITRRLPSCQTCQSLERHRVARRVFDRLHKYFSGKRCLQFSPDPAIDERWFSELTTSIWEGENSLDMQAIALAGGRYDWIYSSHVLNSVPDQAAALREMLRVVGDQGFVVLCVGGTVFNYKTRPSGRSFGRDHQFVLYGTEFADDIQSVLPDVSVVEFVAVDPCTASLDSIYFYSRAEQPLREMAALAASDNIHVRVFSPRAPQSSTAAETAAAAAETAAAAAETAAAAAETAAAAAETAAAAAATRGALPSTLQRKLNKLRRDPAAFFADVKVPSLRLLKGLFDGRNGAGRHASAETRRSGQ
jgi:hypothetical protein